MENKLCWYQNIVELETEMEETVKKSETPWEDICVKLGV